MNWKTDAVFGENLNLAERSDELSRASLHVQAHPGCLQMNKGVSF